MKEIVNALVSLKSFFLGVNGFNDPVLHNPATYSHGYTIHLITNNKCITSLKFKNSLQIFVQIISNIVLSKTLLLSFHFSPSTSDSKVFLLTVTSSVLIFLPFHFQLPLLCPQLCSYPAQITGSITVTTPLQILSTWSLSFHHLACKILNLVKSKLVPTQGLYPSSRILLEKKMQPC